MLRSIPDPNDRYSNFFAAITKSGFYKKHPDYHPILYRRMKGTFEMPVVHCTYLIKADYIKDLTYVDGSDNFEFMIFSQSARNKQIPQFICNKREFGVLLHPHNYNMTLDEEKNWFNQFIKLQRQISVLHFVGE